MAKEYSIDEITAGLKSALPILRSHLRSQAGLDSTAILEVDQTIKGYRESVREYHPHLRGTFEDIESSLSTWVDRASQAKPEQRSAYAAGLDAIERRSDGLQRIAGLHERDEARQAKRA